MGPPIWYLIKFYYYKVAQSFWLNFMVISSRPLSWVQQSWMESNCPLSTDCQFQGRSRDSVWIHQCLPIDHCMLVHGKGFKIRCNPKFGEILTLVKSLIWFNPNLLEIQSFMKTKIWWNPKFGKIKKRFGSI